MNSEDYKNEISNRLIILAEQLASSPNEDPYRQQKFNNYLGAIILSTKEINEENSHEPSFPELYKDDVECRFAATADNKSSQENTFKSYYEWLNMHRLITSRVSVKQNNKLPSQPTLIDILDGLIDQSIIIDI